MESLPALSIIIVNYQSVWFAEQAIGSIASSKMASRVQVIVVNNDTREPCTKLLGDLLPGITIVENTDNNGFAQACNLGLKEVTAPVVLFLNPDTILGSKTLEVCLHYLEMHPEAGALGVRMIDGSGNYLPESKRGLPTLSASFFKLSGVYRLFPDHSHINRYYAGDLQGVRTGQTPVLAGAFLMARRQVLHQIGGFDEAFFMYGEDIDLSYRIGKAGWQNHYLAEGATMLHFKGESTSKSSPDYLRRFYGAMQLFVQKHYPPHIHQMYALLINAAKKLSAIKHRALPRTKVPTMPYRIIHLMVAGDQRPEKDLLLAAIQQHYRQPIHVRLTKLEEGVPDQTTDLLFCPGSDMPADQCFIWMQQHAGKYTYWFHLPGSRSIVGSPLSHTRGTVLLLKND